ncbi:MAG: DUF523 and DUF1722 domain-containing protein [Longimicrobiales bacterium]|nr:DUF523 and DUF1722 domain-containing protein [Longimicrobiales bacterium]
MDQEEFGRPRIVLSRCLELEACRYNAQTIRSSVVRLIEPYVEFVATCPEVEIGLGVPRDPIRLVAAKQDGSGPVQLVQPSTGRDLTEEMTRFGHRFADATTDIDGLLLKSRSPSCGIKDVKLYAAPEDAPVAGKGAGMFAGIMTERFPTAAMEDEGRLTNAELRHHWLTRIFASVALRAALEEGAAGLVGFHTRYKLILMAHSPEGQRELGRVVAAAGDDFEAAATAYRSGFAEAMEEPAGRGAHVNAIQHAQGYFKKGLASAEKRQFESLQGQYREGRLPLQALLAVLGSWVERFDEPYLREQRYFRPYPQPLVVAADSGRARLA